MTGRGLLLRETELFTTLETQVQARRNVLLIADDTGTTIQKTVGIHSLNATPCREVGQPFLQSAMDLMSMSLKKMQTPIREPFKLESATIMAVAQDPVRRMEHGLSLWKLVPEPEIVQRVTLWSTITKRVRLSSYGQIARTVESVHGT
jgi:hypothetical protein